MSAPDHATSPLSPERQRQLAALKLLWLFVAEQTGEWPTAFRLTTRLQQDLGLGPVEGHRFLQRLSDEFRGVQLPAADYFGPTPASLGRAPLDAVLRRILRLLKRWGLFPAPPALPPAGARPLTLATLAAAVLRARAPELAEPQRAVETLAHDLTHWARHLERPPRRGLGGLLSLFNRGRVYEPR